MKVTTAPDGRVGRNKDISNVCNSRGLTGSGIIVSMMFVKMAPEQVGIKWMEFMTSGMATVAVMIIKIMAAVSATAFGENMADEEDYYGVQCKN